VASSVGGFWRPGRRPWEGGRRRLCGRVAVVWMLTTVPGCAGSGSVEVLVRRALLSGVARVRSEGLLSPVKSVALPGCRSLARWVTVGRGTGVSGRNPWPVGHDGGDACGHLRPCWRHRRGFPSSFHPLDTRVKTQFLLEWAAATPLAWCPSWRRRIGCRGAALC
jgi:hypothetical protein